MKPAAEYGPREGQRSSSLSTRLRYAFCIVATLGSALLILTAASDHLATGGLQAWARESAKPDTRGIASSRAEAARPVVLNDPAEAFIANVDPRLISPDATGGLATEGDSGDHALGKAPGDVFYVYGGPGTVEGRFQELLLDPGGNPDSQGWTFVDDSVFLPIWRATTTNAATLGGGAPDNHAAASNHDGPDYFGYGYGWDDRLVLTIDLAVLGLDPGDPATVRWTCQFVHDVEPGYGDAIRFEMNHAGTWSELFFKDGSSYNEISGVYEPVDFDSEHHGSIAYAGGDYVGGESIQLRLRVTSDGAFDDQSGLWPTEGRGAAAVDDIQVWVNDVLVSSADFEPTEPGGPFDRPEGVVEGHDNGAGPATSGWTPTPSDPRGECANQALVRGPYGPPCTKDPCRVNLTPQWLFLYHAVPDPGVCVPRPGSSCTHDCWDDVLIDGCPALKGADFPDGESNELRIVSPPIAWDLPGPEEDDAAGALLGFTNYIDMSLSTGWFWGWRIRTREMDGDWTAWKDNNFVYTSSAARYRDHVVDISGLIDQPLDEIQLSLYILDLTPIFGFPGNDIPAPTFDDVWVARYESTGPRIAVPPSHLATDGFPVDGSVTGPVRFDAASVALSGGTYVVPDDEININITPLIPGTDLVDPAGGDGGVMKCALMANPAYAAERAAALASLGAVLDPAGQGHPGWSFYAFEVAGQANPGVGDDFYAFDLPDGPANPNAVGQTDEDPLLFPGDVLHWYVEAEDTEGTIATLPHDRSWFNDFRRGFYPGAFTVNCLPSAPSVGPAPRILWWNGDGPVGSELELENALHFAGHAPGVTYDRWNTRHPGVSIGLGAANAQGATAAQLEGYDLILYTSGDWRRGLISDGSNASGNGPTDDVQLLRDWEALVGDRTHVYFGDSFAEAMVNQGATTTSYLQDMLGTVLVGDDVAPGMDGERNLLLTPIDAAPFCFSTEPAVIGGCPEYRDFDAIDAFGLGTTLSHIFEGDAVLPVPSTPAGVLGVRLPPDGNKSTLVFPFDLASVQSRRNEPGSAVQARAELLDEVLTCFGLDGPINVGTLPELGATLRVHQNSPNPFNPTTLIRYEAPSRGHLRIRILDVRGRVVATLLDEPVEAGPGSMAWFGRDDRGANVASGVYLYEVQGFGRTEVQKMALLK